MKRFERFHRQGKEICIIFCICTSYQNHIIIVVLNRSKWDLFLGFNISFQESALSKISLRSYEFSEALTWRSSVLHGNSASTKVAQIVATKLVNSILEPHMICIDL